MVIKFNLTPEERMKENILNGLDENASVFRFVKTDRLFEILKTKKIALVKPWKWDDPFENFLSKTVVVNKKKGIRSRAIIALSLRFNTLP
ncbi:MAG: hypothetical protein MUP73_05235 [Dehalococcoidia bacterium]|nr:hypothetical protein [Dehalococcoidia bacterium]